MLTFLFADPVRVFYAGLGAFFLGMPLIWLNDYTRHRSAAELSTDRDSLSQLG
ncbi:MAG: hypothetical protein INR62_05900 [Rhodospirillales bacterium]|nr:hypothetical protein [Acetobacter sp.]